MTFDPAHWPKVGATPAGAYYEYTPEILVAVPRPGYEQTAEGARGSLAEFARLAHARGCKQVLIVMLDRLQSQDGESRRVWRNELDPGLICGLALCGSSMLAQAIGSFFIGLSRPPVPTRLWQRFDDAAQWARERVAEGGGLARSRATETSDA